MARVLCGKSSSPDFEEECPLLIGAPPEIAQLTIEVLRAFFGEEDPGSLKLNSAQGSWDGFTQPVGPFGVEVNVVRTPNDQRWRFKRLQLRLDRYCVPIVKSHDEAFQIPSPLFVDDEGTKIGLYGLVRYIFRMLIGRSESLRRAIDGFVREHCIERST